MVRFRQKLAVPTPSAFLVTRQDIYGALDRAITTRSLVIITAPAGWGKTTTLTQWASNSRFPCCWYTLDQADRDPSIFLDYLMHALCPLIPDLNRLIDQAATAGPCDYPAMLREIAGIIAASGQEFALILDDFHVIEADEATPPDMHAAINDFLVTLTEYAPACHLVLATRTPPVIRGLIRLIAQKRATILDTHALGWTVADIQRLAYQVYDMLLPERSAQALVDYHNGWATGIVLALDHAAQRGRYDPEDLTTTTSTHVYSFLAEQVVSPLPGELQQFLEDTSLLDYLFARRCDLLRDTSGSEALLNEVKRRGLFVSTRGEWLTLHSLFRDFLRSRLAQDPVREQRLLQRAAVLYVAESDIERALECYLAADSVEQACQVLREHIASLRQQSHQTTLLACFERLSQEQPLPVDLLLAQARAFCDLALWERAYATVQLAETLALNATLRDEARILQADILVVQGAYDQARNVFQDIQGHMLPHHLRFDYACTAGRIAISQHCFDDAIQSLESAQTLAAESLAPHEVPAALARIFDNLGLVCARKGDRLQALRHLQRADVYWQSCGNSGRRCVTLNNLGMLAMEQNRFIEAREAFQTGIRLVQETGRQREETDLRNSLADLDVREGHLEQALSHFATTCTLAEHLDLTWARAYAAVGAFWAAVLSRRSDQAYQWRALTTTWGDFADHPDADLLCLRRSLANGLLDVYEQQITTTRISEVASYPLPELTSPVERVVYLFLTNMRQWQHRIDTGKDLSPDWQQFRSEAMCLPVTILEALPDYQLITSNGVVPRAFVQQISNTLTWPVERRWHVKALGEFVCLVDDQPRQFSVLHQTLLTRLLDSDGQIALERLWEDVWGERDLSVRAIHQAIYRLRNQTDLSITVRDNACFLNTHDIDYDVCAFEHAISTATPDALEIALELYRGDFLPQATASVWVEARRTYLLERYLSALEQLATSLEPINPARALAYYQRALKVDGCREQTATAVMQIAARFGNHSLIATTYECLCRSLDTLGTGPSAETIQFYRHLLTLPH